MQRRMLVALFLATLAIGPASAQDNERGGVRTETQDRVAGGGSPTTSSGIWSGSSACSACSGFTPSMTRTAITRHLSNNQKRTGGTLMRLSPLMIVAGADRGASGRPGQQCCGRQYDRSDRD